MKPFMNTLMMTNQAIAITMARTLRTVPVPGNPMPLLACFAIAIPMTPITNEMTAVTIANMPMKGMKLPRSESAPMTTERTPRTVTAGGGPELPDRRARRGRSSSSSSR